MSFLHPALTRIGRTIPLLLVIAMVVPYVVIAVYWRVHDTYDDSGYMLAIFKQLAEGGVLYQEVFSQYGPFHGQAWTAFFKAFGFPVDHNHAGLGVVLLWLGSVALAGVWTFVATRSHLTTWAGVVWAAWAFHPYTAEIGHPLSLCGLLVWATLCATSSAPVESSARRLAVWRAAGGIALAALVWTKINLGLFQGLALSLGLILTWNGGRRLAGLACTASLLIPFVLVNDAWPLLPRAFLTASVVFPMVMVGLVWKRADFPPRPWKAEASAWTAGFTLGTAAILGLSLVQGLTLSEIVAGVLTRPLQLSGQFTQRAHLDPWDWGFAALSATLAVLWLVAGRSRLARAWPWLVATAAGLVLSHALISGLLWTTGMSGLLWLPLTLITMAPSGSGARRDGDINGTFSRSALFLTLAAIWQTLGVFPVCGAQQGIPGALNLILWVATLTAALSRTTSASANANGSLRARSIRGVVITLTALPLIALGYLEYSGRLQTYTRPGLPGAEWFALPPAQAAVLKTLSANTSQTQGPLFTFHGQSSLVFWAGKRFVNGYNCTHITGILLPEELDVTLAEYRKHTQWSCAVYGDGGLFGKGPLYPQVQEFVQTHTRPWFKVQEYHVSLAGSQVSPPLKHAIWKASEVWMGSAPAEAVQTAKKWRLRTHRQVGSGRWSQPGTIPSPAPSSSGSSSLNGDYHTFTLPPGLVASLEKLSPEDQVNVSLWLCDKHWTPLAGMALVTLTGD
jgi:hypothetical protein